MQLWSIELGIQSTKLRKHLHHQKASLDQQQKQNTRRVMFDRQWGKKTNINNFKQTKQNDFCE